jgi:hypothetical protein
MAISVMLNFLFSGSIGKAVNQVFIEHQDSIQHRKNDKFTHVGISIKIKEQFVYAVYFFIEKVYESNLDELGYLSS